MIVIGICALLLIMLFFGVTNYIVTSSFNTYMQENQNRRNANLIDYLQSDYETNGQFSEDVKSNILHQAMMNHFYITILDHQQNIIWDLKQSYLDMMNGMMGNGETANQYHENTYVIDSEINPDIYIIIGQFESTLLSTEDIHFKESLNKGLIITAIVGLITTISLGFYVSRQFSKPIVQLKEATDTLRQGDLQTRVKLASHISEIDELKLSINHLASTLEEQEYLRKRLTSDTSHELRTPLHILQNQFEALIDGIWEPTKERLQICYNEISRLTDLVSDLEKLTNIDQNTMELVKEHCSLKELILPIIHKFEASLLVKQIKMEYKLDEHIYAWIDKDKMTQVMINLLSNAYKFTESGGTISIHVTLEKKIVKIFVSDTGVGIPEQESARIFERFYRVEQSRNRKTGGSGLGLSIVKAIITAHGGNIVVKSKPDVGTTFIVSIPSE